MPDIFEIDVAGSDIFSRNYSIGVVYNNSKRYGYRFTSSIQQSIVYNNQNNVYCIDNSKSLKPRVYAAVLLLILKRIAKKEKISKDYKFLICDDFYGHFNQVCDLLVRHLQSDFPGLNKEKHLSKCKHHKKSLIQQTVTEIYAGNFEGKTMHNFELNDIEEFLSKCRIRK